MTVTCSRSRSTRASRRSPPRAATESLPNVHEHWERASARTRLPVSDCSSFCVVISDCTWLSVRRRLRYAHFRSAGFARPLWSNDSRTGATISATAFCRASRSPLASLWKPLKAGFGKFQERQVVVLERVRSQSFERIAAIRCALARVTSSIFSWLFLRSESSADSSLARLATSSSRVSQKAVEFGFG